MRNSYGNEYEANNEIHINLDFAKNDTVFFTGATPVEDKPANVWASSLIPKSLTTDLVNPMESDSRDQIVKLEER